MSIDNIIDSVNAGSSYWEQGSYYNKKMPNLCTDFLNGNIDISPWLHKKIYNEELSLNNRSITPAIKQHIMIMYLPTGGFNNNDYLHLPIEFSRHTLEMIQTVTDTHPKTWEEANAVSSKLVKTFNLPNSYADTISWYWSGGDDCAHLHKIIVMS